MHTSARPEGEIPAASHRCRLLHPSLYGEVSRWRNHDWSPTSHLSASLVTSILQDKVREMQECALMHVKAGSICIRGQFWIHGVIITVLCVGGFLRDEGTWRVRRWRGKVKVKSLGMHLCLHQYLHSFDWSKQRHSTWPPPIILCRRLLPIFAVWNQILLAWWFLRTVSSPNCLLYIIKIVSVPIRPSSCSVEFKLLD